MKWKSILIVLALTVLTGCALSNPPTTVERHFYDVRTNFMTVVLTQTNVVTITNLASEVLTETNVVTVTNLVTAGYELTPNQNARATTDAGRVVGNLAGVGELVGAALAGLFALWGIVRSRKSNKTAEVLAQIIETGRVVLQSTPQGKALDERWVRWMMEHQAETGVITEVVNLLARAVNRQDANQAATEITELMDHGK